MVLEGVSTTPNPLASTLRSQQLIQAATRESRRGPSLWGSASASTQVGLSVPMQITMPVSAFHVAPTASLGSSRCPPPNHAFQAGAQGGASRWNQAWKQVSDSRA